MTEVREITDVYDMGDCPVCGADSRDSEEAGEGHTVDDYYYTCPDCGLEFSCHREYGGWFKYHEKEDEEGKGCSPTFLLFGAEAAPDHPMEDE
jgi:hypothetical protein